jgi:hypothetical protein
MRREVYRRSDGKFEGRRHVNIGIILKLIYEML